MEAELIGAMAFAIGITAVLIGYWFERKHWRQALSSAMIRSGAVVIDLILCPALVDDLHQHEVKLSDRPMRSPDRVAGIT